MRRWPLIRANGTERKVKVTFRRLRKTLPMTLGANGKLSASVKLASRGSWKASVTFRGNASYAAATSASKAFSVKQRRTVRSQSVCGPGVNSRRGTVPEAGHA